MSDESNDDLEQWIEQAETAFEQLQENIENRQLSDAIGTIIRLVRIANEVEDVLDEVDLTELPDIIDASELPDAIEVEDIPEAIRDDDASEAIDLSALMKAVKLRELWDSANLTALISESKDVADEVGGDVTSGVESTMDDVTDDFDAEGFTDMPSEEWQEVIQLQAMEAISEFREGVIEAHNKLKKVHEENQEKMRRQHDETRAESLNPTAYSSLPTERPDIGGHATHYSTVSARVRHSTAPKLDRIYGHRYDREEDE